MMSTSRIELTRGQDRRRIEEIVEETVERLSRDLNPKFEKLKMVLRIRGGKCYKSDLAWLFGQGERTIEAWGIEPMESSPGRRNVYDLEDVFSQLGG